MLITDEICNKIYDKNFLFPVILIFFFVLSASFEQELCSEMISKVKSILPGTFKKFHVCNYSLRFVKS